ncbi:stationary-phase survival protein SurE [Desulfarculus baarsii DSM 2075]|uniref:5'-nucleotidase SurE n=1 Tax=Desulfarculus baarsii (strain ATCC 33931 / DSM 2075 / LMG 7858 / VKM B-1802 / 2st14) TaxID=644282 RepID=E1QE33_DESB2|nr:5'/3'-nucleotidase SurE [Desulfarculus baarsii]ADK83819.1 stationary-phase survival protein SurE [Desulfarculus baarsii DSM 2075]
MRILLTNDDGVMAAGIGALHQVLCQRHEVFVVAPETEQSAVGHSITLADPIKVRPLSAKTGMNGFAVAGTPADCVKLAMGQLMPQPPDLVVSGINQGANVGVNVLYSGTVSAATEAAILGLRSLAFSLASHTSRDFSHAAAVAAGLIEQYDLLAAPPEVCLNVNIPALPVDQIKGVRLARQSCSRLGERFLRRTDPRGHVYFWQAGESMGVEGGPDTDYPALLEGYVTITPLRHDMTHNQALRRMSEQWRAPRLPGAPAGGDACEK